MLQLEYSQAVPKSDLPLHARARHVDHLSPVQLYKKRAYDRDNQRISRARRKDKAVELEKEIVILKSKIARLEKALADQPVTTKPSPSPSHIWTVLPQWIPPMCQMDNVMNWFTDSASNRNQGSSFEQLFSEIRQMTFPSIASLLNPDGAAERPLSSLIGKHGLWMNVTSSAARTALMYNICIYLRWLISPTKDNYLSLPPFLRPIPLQILNPHPRWMDIVPWPCARERLITVMEWEKDFSTYRTCHNSTVSVNWPRPLSEILINDSDDNVALNPDFIEHIYHLDNWSVGSELADALPYLDCIPLNQS